MTNLPSPNRVMNVQKPFHTVFDRIRRPHGVATQVIGIPMAGHKVGESPVRCERRDLGSWAGGDSQAACGACPCAAHTTVVALQQ